MAQTLILLSLIFLSLGLAPSAGAIDLEIPDFDSAEVVYQWRPVDQQMDPEEYRKAFRNNRSVAGKIARSFLENQLVSLGVSKSTVKITGAAVGILANGARFNLNDSKTMALQLRDVAQRKPSLMFMLNFEWL